MDGVLLGDGARDLALLGVSLPFTLRGRRAGGSFKVLPRILTYYCSLLILVTGGVMHSVESGGAVEPSLQGLAVVVLLILGVTNAWVLVLWREPPLRTPSSG